MIYAWLNMVINGGTVKIPTGSVAAIRTADIPFLALARLPTRSKASPASQGMKAR